MKKFKDKVAVITGAGSGIGYGIAKKCVSEGMNVVLADIEKNALAQSKRECLGYGTKVLSIVTDVSSQNSMEMLVDKTINTFKKVNMLFNNAGVTTRKPVWINSEKDWQWVLGVNLWGVIYGCKYFIPIMLKQDEESHIVNTSSEAGLWSGIGYAGTYSTSKHGVIALSESLFQELADFTDKINISVFCPGAVRSNITDAERYRPQAFKNDQDDYSIPLEIRTKLKKQAEHVKERIKAGITPEEAADIVFDGIRKKKFYILTGKRGKIVIQMHMENILLGKNPTRPKDLKKTYLKTLLGNLLPIPRYRYL